MAFMHNDPRSVRSWTALAGAALFMLYFSGVIRDDVPLKAYKELAMQKQFDCVGQVLLKGKRQGSCTLVGGKYVLSAAHVFLQSDGRPDTIDMNGRQVIVFTHINVRAASPEGYTFKFGSKKYLAERIDLYPNYLDTTLKQHTDLALITLQESVTDVPPAVLSQWDDDLGEAVTSVGYGIFTKAGPTNRDKDKGWKVAGMNVVDSLGGLLQQGMHTVMFADMDHPDEPGLNLMGSPVPLPMEYCMNGGDSGGGCFRNTKEGWQLTGVVAGTSIEIERMLKYGHYGQSMSWTRVAPFVDWVKGRMANL